MDALEKAMYLAFKNVRTTGKNVFIGLDVSGSMSSAACSGLENITARDATAIMAMATVRAEKNVFIGGFSRGFTPLAITASMSMNEVIRVISGLPFESTDCSLPMQYALKKQMDVDTFIVFTDNETYVGIQYPHQALVQYRKAMNKPRAQLIVCATSSTSFTIADPNDPGMFDICGFDSSAPAMISEIMSGF
jgi:60 kDa SS-A/Ro ribonucleoprotein